MVHTYKNGHREVVSWAYIISLGQVKVDNCRAQNINQRSDETYNSEAKDNKGMNASKRKKKVQCQKSLCR